MGMGWALDFPGGLTRSSRGFGPKRDMESLSDVDLGAALRGLVEWQGWPISKLMESPKV